MTGLIKDAIHRAIVAHGEKEFRTLMLTIPGAIDAITPFTKKVINAEGYKLRSN